VYYGRSRAATGLGRPPDHPRRSPHRSGPPARPSNHDRTPGTSPSAPQEWRSPRPPATPTGTRPRRALEDGYDIRAVQALLRHRDARTTMIHAHVL